MYEQGLKELVRQRDGYRCTGCGMTRREHFALFDRDLDVDRIEPGSPYTLDGCRTFCQPCHCKRHGKTSTYERLPGCLMTYIPVRKGWMKEYRGKKFAVSCRQLGCPPSKVESRDAANAWWLSKRAEIDLGRDCSGLVADG